MGSKIFNQQDIAKMLNVSESTIARLREKEGLPYYQFGRSLRFDPQEVKEWMETRRQNGTPITLGATAGYRTDADTAARLNPEPPPSEVDPIPQYQQLVLDFEALQKKHVHLMEQNNNLKSFLREMHRILTGLINGFEKDS